MNKNILTPVIATSLLLGACSNGEQSEQSVPKEDQTIPSGVESSARAYIDRFGCAFDGEIVMSIDTIEDVEQLNNSTLIAQSDPGIIVFNALSSIDLWDDVTAHELGHACVDGTVETLLTEQIPLPIVEDTIIGSEGFSLQLLSGYAIPMIDEGVAEWIAEGIPGSIPSNDPSYNASRITTQIAAEYRSLDKETVLGLQRNNDITGFIALLKNKPREEVNNSDFSDIVYLYTAAYGDGIIPVPEDVHFLLDFKTSQ